MVQRWFSILIMLSGTLGFAATVLDTEARDADADLGLVYVFMDSPWRVQLRDPATDYIPVQFHFPETKAGWETLKITRLAVDQIVGDRVVALFEDTDQAPPACHHGCGGDLLAVDGFGKTTDDLDLVVGFGQTGLSPWQIDVVNSTNRGWHTILRIPLAQLSLRDGSTPVLAARASYRRILKGIPEKKEHTLRKVMRISLDPEPFPSFAGWHHYDMHVHTSSEFEDGTGLVVIRKDFGGPFQMYREVAYAQGLCSAPNGDFKHRVMATDHNVFVSDDTAPSYGPIAVNKQNPDFGQQLYPYFVDHEGKHSPVGQMEYERNLGLFGITFNEELTLAKENPINKFPINLGTHMLAYSTRHFMGPFHGGTFFFGLSAKNINRIGYVLEHMATNPNYPRGFSYAAHPFMEQEHLVGLPHWVPIWEDEQLAIAMTQDHVHRDADGNPRDFVFKGLEFWNGKDTQKVTARLSNRGKALRLLENPYQEKEWQAGRPHWDAIVNYSMVRWQRLVRQALQYSFQDKPEQKFIRKLYFGGATDAHGSFSRTTSTLARSLTQLPLPVRLFTTLSIDSNAFSLVRTHVEGTNEPSTYLNRSQQWLDSLSEGRGVMTDGPIATFSLDANPHFDSATLRWHDQPKYENDDGKIGGEGPMDGGRTMLTIKNDLPPMFKYQWKNTKHFGGEIQRIEIYKTSLITPPATRAIPSNDGRKTEAPSALGYLEPTPANGQDAFSPLLDAKGSHLKAQALTNDLGAVVLAAFTARTERPPFDHRCYTNAIWIVPVAVESLIKQYNDLYLVDLRFIFPVSMQPRNLQVGLIPLDAEGNADPASEVLLSPNDEQGGWGKANGIDHSAYSVSGYLQGKTGNPSGKYIFYLKDPHDLFGNRLNSVASILSDGK